ncbi:hypothetical protein BT63DRAFT_473881 [Microthyrium microscopicum]|uniref:Ubiquitin-like domain-containing protein n=1 Tax=Microthyrium microscopicum TaxID=703497 RepID=A0A6A6URR2_9PEZI|nr:hypothetical protein BT63DRAFT_473881 [Microthyrium microscopicum]
MDDVFDNINVVSLDGSQKFEFSGLPRQMGLSRFKSLVTMRIQRQEGRYVNPLDLNLMPLSSYNIRDDDTITRVDSAGRDPSIRPPTVVTQDPPNNEIAPPPYEGRVLKNVFVQDAHRTYTLNDVPVTTSVEQLFERIKNEKAVNTDSVGLIFGGKQLAKGRNLTLADYDIQENSTMVLIVKLPGGRPFVK